MLYNNMSDKYKNGKIYTIRYQNDDSLIYVGSTIQPLFKRWYEHKSKANNEKYKAYNLLLYQKIRVTNNLNDWYIELYEEFSCENKEQLNKREGTIIREIGTLIRMYIDIYRTHLHTHTHTHTQTLHLSGDGTDDEKKEAKMLPMSVYEDVWHTSFDDEFAGVQ